MLCPSLNTMNPGANLALVFDKTASYLRLPTLQGSCLDHHRSAGSVLGRPPPPPALTSQLSLEHGLPQNDLTLLVFRLTFSLQKSQSLPVDLEHSGLDVDNHRNRTLCFTISPLTGQIKTSFVLFSFVTSGVR